MANLKSIGVIVDTLATIELTGEELKALDALAGYNLDATIEMFYKQMGRSYLQPHEAGLRSFLKAVNGCAGITKAADECRQFMVHEEADRRAALNSVRAIRRAG